MRLAKYILIAVLLIMSARDDQTGDCLRRGDCKDLRGLEWTKS